MSQNIKFQQRMKEAYDMTTLKEGGWTYTKIGKKYNISYGTVKKRIEWRKSLLDSESEYISSNKHIFKLDVSTYVMKAIMDKGIHSVAELTAKSPFELKEILGIPVHHCYRLRTAIVKWQLWYDKKMGIFHSVDYRDA